MIVTYNLLKFRSGISSADLRTLSDAILRTHAHKHPFNGPLSWTTQVSRYQKGKTNLDYTEARDSEWQWYQLSAGPYASLHLAPDR